MIFKVYFALKLSNYTSLKRFICLKLIKNKFLHNTTFSVRLHFGNPETIVVFRVKCFNWDTTRIVLTK